MFPREFHQASNTTPFYKLKPWHSVSSTPVLFYKMPGTTSPGKCTGGSIRYNSFESIRSTCSWVGTNFSPTDRDTGLYSKHGTGRPPVKTADFIKVLGNSALRLLLKSGCQCRTGNFFGVASHLGGDDYPLKFLRVWWFYYVLLLLELAQFTSSTTTACHGVPWQLWP